VQFKNCEIGYFFFSSLPSYFRLTSSRVSLLSHLEMASLSKSSSDNLWLILDAYGNKAAPLPPCVGRAIGVSSVRSENFENFTKEGGVNQLYFPRFDESEILALIKILGRDADLPMLMDLFLLLGGVPRYLFRYSLSDLQSKLTRAYNSIDAAKLKKAVTSHFSTFPRACHMFVTLEIYNFQHVATRFSSDWVCEVVSPGKYREALGSGPHCSCNSSRPISCRGAVRSSGVEQNRAGGKEPDLIHVQSQASVFT